MIVNISDLQKGNGELNAWKLRKYYNNRYGIS